jgi:hypothetical protein
MLEKPKRDFPAYAYELIPDEQVLWTGKPDPRVLFTWHDVFLIPFSLLWCGFVATFWLNGTFFDDDAPNSVFRCFILPHTFAGLYFLVGRFIIKVIEKLHTEYVLTDSRALVINTLFGRQVKSVYLSDVYHVERSRFLGSTGSIIFTVATPPHWWQRRSQQYNNAGLGNSQPGFYDIHESDDVYMLLTERIVEGKQKRKRVA